MTPLSNATTRLTPINLVASCALFGLAVSLLLDSPVISELLLVIALIFILGMWIWPMAWLLVLPVALPLLDLAPWSGRFLLDEFDALVCLALSVGLLRHHQVESSLSASLKPSFWLISGLLFSSYLISFWKGFLPYQVLDSNAWSGYYTHWNALRLAKGFLEGFSLALLLARQRAYNPQVADALMLRGLVAGVFVFGCIVLWERGVFGDLAHASHLYSALSGLLNFSTKYRITGLFSQMHLGGAAVDGYLVLGTIFPLLLLFKSRSWVEHGWAFVTLTLAFYAVLVTFTRGTYVTVFLSVMVFLAMLYLKAIKHGIPGLLKWLMYIGLSMAALVIMLAGFQRGGSVTVFAMSMAIIGGGGYSLVNDKLPKTVSRLALLAGFVLVMLISVRGILTSKYTDVGLMEAILVGALGSAVLVLASLWLFRVLPRDVSIRASATALLALALALPVMVTGLSNTRMEVRFSQIDQDINTRINHWKDGFSLMPSSIENLLFGLGLGAYPNAYLLNVDLERKTGNVWFDQENDQQLIKLGGGILRTGQRIDQKLTGRFKLRFTAKQSLGAGVLEFRLCQRPMLVQESWIPICANSWSVRVEPIPGWQTKVIQLDFSEFKPLSWYQPHFLLFSFGNAKAQTIIDVAELELIDEQGRSLLSNGDFKRGGDRWMIYSDFEHLPWHAKNLFLHILLEQGIWGLLIFAVTVLISLRLAFRQALQGDLLSKGIFAVTIGFLTLGLVATLFDVPRLVCLFYLLLLLPLIKQWQVLKPSRHRSHRHRRRSSSHSNEQGLAES